MPLGLLVWLVLIFIIACCSGAFIKIVALLLGIFILYVIGCIVYNLYYDNKREDKEEADRERAINEWEKKWGRKHPSRKYIRKK